MPARILISFTVRLICSALADLSSRKCTLDRYHAIAASTCSTRTIHLFDSILQHFDYRQRKNIVLLSTLDSRFRSSFREPSFWLYRTLRHFGHQHSLSYVVFPFFLRYWVWRSGNHDFGSDEGSMRGVFGGEF